jgi:hypothetical protein
MELESGVGWGGEYCIRKCEEDLDFCCFFNEAMRVKCLVRIDGVWDLIEIYGRNWETLKA